MGADNLAHKDEGALVEVDGAGFTPGDDVRAVVRPRERQHVRLEAVVDRVRPLVGKRVPGPQRHLPAVVPGEEAAAVRGPGDRRDVAPALGWVGGRGDIKVGPEQR